MKRAAAVSAAVALATAMAFAQSQQPYFETFEVRLHNLDVVVTDAKGKAVHGLTKDDFIVLEDGVQQNITNFSAYDDGTWKVSAATATAASAPAPQPIVEEKPPARRFVFFIDDMAMQENVRRNVIRHTNAVIDEMREGDLGTVVRPTGPNRVAQNYTTDKAALRKAVTEAVESCTIRLDAPGLAEQMQLSRSLAESASEPERNHAKGVYAQQSRDRVQQRLAQLRALVGSLAGVEGRKVLMLVTAGIPSYPGRDAVDFEEQMKGGVVKTVTDWGQHGDFTPYIDDLARTAAANGITVYALEPEVPVAVGIQKAGASRTLGSLSRPGRGAIVDPRNPPTAHLTGQQVMPPQMLPELLTYRAQTLTSLTEKTGGKWFRGGGTVDDLFRQVATDMRTYYSLAYRATGSGDRPRRIEVRVRNRPELRVRTRTEVIDRPLDREMADAIFANLLFPRDLHELKVRVEPGKPVAAGKAYNLPIDILIPLDKLTFAPVDGGKYAAIADIHFAAAGVMNNFITSGRHRQNIVISAEQHAARTGVTTRFKTALLVPKGRTRLAVGVMDEASRQAGFANVDVNAE